MFYCTVYTIDMGTLNYGTPECTALVQNKHLYISWIAFGGTTEMGQSLTNSDVFGIEMWACCTGI